MEHKTGKYLAYAIGEIILVVIGILIALQINNWNEIHKQEKIEKSILLEIKNNLQKDLIDLNGNMKGYGRKSKSHNYIINWLESNQGFQDSLQNALLQTSFSTDIFINQSAYENLKQIGLRSIRNDSLRNQISHLYESEYKTYIEYNKELTDAVKTINADYAMYFNGPGSHYKNEKILFKNLDDLKNDFSFMYHQKLARDITSILDFVRAPKVKAEVKKTIEMIEAELKSRL